MPPRSRVCDSDIIQKELKNLKYFKSLTGIVQPAGILPSQNVQEMVVGSIWLEYYSGGSLQCVLNEQRVKEFGWERWIVRIGNAFSFIHCAKKTHMDLKPSNIVLDDNACRLNGIWAYGKILTEIVSSAGDSPFARTPKWVASHLTKEDIRTQWTLSKGISQLKLSQYVV
ncbi:uncharacterized protein N7479_011098 [Penicillium vulpinum]|uniref:uncharacterized protein n=1 Tax=Penicillium vulpinum TaxID=29845 RepID=UPI00254806F3|nr:uncharacterized protein N7479_011098 [Penicillium vulpinum]KAJ5952685.1 hypothetical protein N7479_011098 [Penicillium vulpinum]